MRAKAVLVVMALGALVSVALVASSLYVRPDAAPAPAPIVGYRDPVPAAPNAQNAQGRALLAPANSGAWEAELLLAYGLGRVGRLEPGAALPDSMQGIRALIIADRPLDETSRRAVRAYLSGGGHVVELGPKPAVCGAALADGLAPDPLRHVSGEGLDGVRWPVAVAAAEACDGGDCSEGAEVAASVNEGEGGHTLLSRHLVGRGTCSRWHGDLALAIQRLRQGDPALVREARVPKAGFLFSAELSAQDHLVPSADRLGFALMREVVRAPGRDGVVHVLPARAQALLLFTVDQDFVRGDALLAHSGSAGGRGFSALLTAPHLGGKPDVSFEGGDQSFVSAQVVDELSRRGHGVGLHPNLLGVPEHEQLAVLAAHVTEFTQRFGTAPLVVRNHHLSWAGYTQMAQWNAEVGLAMNLDYVTLRRGPVYHPGFMTGSGLPVRFVDEAGAVLPVYQQAGQLDDSLLLPGSGLDRQAATVALIRHGQTLLETAGKEHVAITVLHHSIWWHETGGSFQGALFQAADRVGAPVWGTEQWLSFTERRRRVTTSTAAGRLRVASGSPDLALLIEGSEAVKGAAPGGSYPVELAGQRFTALPLTEAPVELSIGE